MTIFRDGILASRSVTDNNLAPPERMLNPHSDVNTSPELSYRTTLGTLRVTNASSSGNEYSSVTDVSMIKGE